MTDPSPSLQDSLLVRHRALLLTALGVLVYVAFLGQRDMWYPDEPDIAEVAQAMYVSGDWVAPRRVGVIWVDYPPMIYWTACIAAHALGGMSEFALRLPCALAAIALVLLTCAAASRWFGARTGLWAGFLLLIFPQFMYQAVSYRTDMLFTLFIGAGLFAYARGVEDRPRWGLRILAFALLGLAVLSKGPLGLLLPGLVLTLWHASRREWRLMLGLVPLGLLSLAIYMPWFVACAHAMGRENILEELYAQNLERFNSGLRGHEHPAYYYLTRIWLDLAPWSLLMPFAIAWIVRARLWRDRHVQLALWWFGAFLVFLSIAVTKRQVYLQPAYPAAALLIARWLTAATREEIADRPPDPRPASYMTGLLAGLLLLVGVASLLGAVALDWILAPFELDELAQQTALGMRLPLVGLAAVALPCGLWIGRAWRRGELRPALHRTAATQVALYVALLWWILPAVNPVKTYAPQSRWIREQIGSETVIGLVNPGYGHRKMGAFGYYTGALVELLRTADEIEAFLTQHPRSLVLIQTTVSDQLLAELGAEWQDRIVRELQTSRYRYVVVRGR